MTFAPGKENPIVFVPWESNFSIAKWVVRTSSRKFVWIHRPEKEPPAKTVCVCLLAHAGCLKGPAFEGPRVFF